MLLQWQRAETLGALVNGVFLVALCLSIFLEAIQRFVEPQIVSNPLLVLIVGCFGLLSNILGLFLFHDHGHSHGSGHGHPHDATAQAEGGQSHTHTAADEGGNIEDVLPESVVAAQAQPQKGTPKGSENMDPDSPNSTRKTSYGPRRPTRRSSGSRHHRYRSLTEDDNIHPASFRNSIIAASRLEDIDSSEATESENEAAILEEPANEQSPLLAKTKSPGSQHLHKSGGSYKQDPHSHANHKHTKPSSSAAGGHSHADLNMRGLFLHVMGDALGNLGVIGSALFIWLTPYWWKYYADPFVSLIITIIILASAIPLCKAASRILLQAVPAGIDVIDIKDDIRELPGIVDCHHVHVWQLSDTKLISSLHIVVDYDFKGEGSARYMKLAQSVRECLHAYGIHSSTIQPEFDLNPYSSPGGMGGMDGNVDSSAGPSPRQNSRTGSVRSEARACMLECGDECADGSQCCAPGSAVEGGG